MERGCTIGVCLSLFLSTFSACSSSDDSTEGTIEVGGPTGALTAFDDTAQLTATALDPRGEPVGDSNEYVWSSSDMVVATVDVNGLVTARGNGAATITARSANFKPGSTRIEVAQVPAAVEISPPGWDHLWIGARQQFTAATTDANGHPIDDAAVMWSTSDAMAVEVNAVGLATAMSSGSDVQITAAAGVVTDLVDVTVPHEVRSQPGAMYTVWFARTDSAPALLVSGEIKVPDEVLDSIDYEGPRAPWPHLLPGQDEVRRTVHKFQWEGDRIGLLTDMANGAGTFRALDRVGEWTNLAIGDAIDFQLEGNRIGLLQSGGRFRVKEGVSGPWTTLASTGASSFRLEGNRIGLRHDDGMFRVKDGVDGEWTVLVEPGGTPRFQLEGNRIAVILVDGTFRAKDGIHGAWTTLADDAADIRLRGDRIALLHEDGTLRVKDGIHGAWTTLATEPIRQFELEGDRIGILFESGVFQVKDGIHGPWEVLATTDVREFQLQGGRIGVLMDSGVLRVKTGIFGAYANTPAYGPNVTQFRLAVDVPVQPFRTTKVYYDTKQNQCITFNDATENDCYHVPGFDVPVSNYGWYCGQGRPYAYQNIIRQTEFLLDSLDALCRHHDTVKSWYPEAGGLGDAFAACIVKYGLHHGRLTRNGSLLANGTSSSEVWDEAWASVSMVNLKDSLDNYFTHTNGCTEGNLADFTEDTASRN